jgi:hypothetical protein
VVDLLAQRLPPRKVRNVSSTGVMRASTAAFENVSHKYENEMHCGLMGNKKRSSDTRAIEKEQPATAR